jgi:RNA polymerase sigma-70 factor (ECF subfamily)
MERLQVRRGFYIFDLVPSTMDRTADKSVSQKPGEPVSDEQLMLDFCRGSKEAFTDLFSRYKQPLFGFFCRRIGGICEAEELTQETFLALLRGSLRYQPSALFRTYLYAIALKILRASRRKAAFRATFFGTFVEHHEPATRSAPHEEILLRQAVAKLERVDREILLLREFEQLSYAEIAAVLKLPLNTVRSRLFRARSALHDLLSAPVAKTSNSKLTASEERA